MMTLLGIDVSHWQGDVDWFAVARGNVKFAFAKASEGNVTVDPTFKQNWSGIQVADLIRGAYHFARPGRDAETQARRYLPPSSVRSGLEICRLCSISKKTIARNRDG
jgi:lysozyme